MKLMKALDLLQDNDKKILKLSHWIKLNKFSSNYEPFVKMYLHFPRSKPPTLCKGLDVSSSCQGQMGCLEELIYCLLLSTVGCLWHISDFIVNFQGIHVLEIHFKSFNTFFSYGCYCYSPLWKHVLVMLELDLK